MHVRRRSACALAIVFLLAGCNSSDDWSRPHTAPDPVGALGPGFVDPSAPPSPEATITPSPGSWDDVHPGEGYRVVLLTAGTDAQTKTLDTAVHDWASAENVSLKTITADDPSQYTDKATEAIKLAPDLIISAGNGLVDPLAVITANHLNQQFLVIGAELAEPTANVTAATWAGASYRGEGLGTSTSYDPASFTPAHATAALRAGAAAVLTRHTGIVIWIS